MKKILVLFITITIFTTSLFTTSCRPQPVAADVFFEELPTEVSAAYLIENFERYAGGNTIVTVTGVYLGFEVGPGYTVRKVGPRTNGDVLEFEFPLDYRWKWEQGKEITIRAKAIGGFSLRKCKVVK